MKMTKEKKRTGPEEKAYREGVIDQINEDSEKIKEAGIIYHNANLALHDPEDCYCDGIDGIKGLLRVVVASAKELDACQQQLDKMDRKNTVNRVALEEARKAHIYMQKEIQAFKTVTMRMAQKDYIHGDKSFIIVMDQEHKQVDI